MNQVNIVDAIASLHSHFDDIHNARKAGESTVETFLKEQQVSWVTKRSLKFVANENRIYKLFTKKNGKSFHIKFVGYWNK